MRIVALKHGRREVAGYHAPLITPGALTVLPYPFKAGVGVKREGERLAAADVNEQACRARPTDGERHPERRRLLALYFLCQRLRAIERTLHGAGLHADDVVNSYSHTFFVS